MSKLRDIYIFLWKTADYINRNELFGWFLAIGMLICLVCTIGVSYAMRNLEIDYTGMKHQVEVTNQCVVQKVDSLATDIKVMDGKLDIIVNFVEDK